MFSLSSFVLLMNSSITELSVKKANVKNVFRKELRSGNQQTENMSWFWKHDLRLKDGDESAWQPYSPSDNNKIEKVDYTPRDQY